MQFLAPEAYLPPLEVIYAELSRTLRDALPYADVDHIGSSAIQGAISKGDLDVLVRVPNERFADALARIRTLGFSEKQGTLRTESLCMLVSDHHAADVAIQLVERGSHFEMFLTFRDRLNADPALVAAYNALKESCTGLAPDAYRERKSKFIEAVLAG